MKKVKTNITFGDAFRAYLKPSLKGRLVIRKKGANRYSPKVILYNEWVRACFSSKSMAPIMLAKEACRKSRTRKEDCDRIRTLRTYLALVLRAIRSKFEDEVSRVLGIQKDKLKETPPSKFAEVKVSQLSCPSKNEILDMITPSKTA